MIKIENVVCPSVEQWKAVIRGCRNSFNSWDKSNSNSNGDTFIMGENDKKLLISLADSTSDKRKFMRMIPIYVDITAPVYWWAEMDTYKIGTVRNSCSFMHKGASRDFTLDDFNITDEDSKAMFTKAIEWLNILRSEYVHTKDPSTFEAIRDFVPQGYMLKATMFMNYEVLNNIYWARRDHRLSEWRDFCEWIETLPYSALITCDSKEDELDNADE